MFVCVWGGGGGSALHVQGELGGGGGGSGWGLVHHVHGECMCYAGDCSMIINDNNSKKKTD